MEVCSCRPAEPAESDATASWKKPAKLASVVITSVNPDYTVADP
jgi:hypothetical protein